MEKNYSIIPDKKIVSVIEKAISFKLCYIEFRFLRIIKKISIGWIMNWFSRTSRTNILYESSTKQIGCFSERYFVATYYYFNEKEKQNIIWSSMKFIQFGSSRNNCGLCFFQSFYEKEYDCFFSPKPWMKISVFLWFPKAKYNHIDYIKNIFLTFQVEKKTR